MSYGLRVLHVCDHTVKEVKYTKTDKSIQRSIDSDTDNITEKQIDTVDYVLFGNLFLFDGYHFITSGEEITWIGNDEVIPQPGDYYDIFFTEKEVTNKGYADDNCPKCGGRGWYVDTISPDGEALVKSEFVDKLVQDFIKTLLTNSKYYEYGTTLSSLVGQIHKDGEVKSKIIMAIREAEEKVKKAQYELSLEGVDIGDNQALRVVNIDELYRNEYGDGYYVKVTLYTRSNLSVSIGLDL